MRNIGAGLANNFAIPQLNPLGNPPQKLEYPRKDFCTKPFSIRKTLIFESRSYLHLFQGGLE